MGSKGDGSKDFKREETYSIDSYIKGYIWREVELWGHEKLYFLEKILLAVYFSFKAFLYMSYMHWTNFELRKVFSQEYYVCSFLWSKKDNH